MSDDSSADRAMVGGSKAASIAAWIERVRTVPRLHWPELAIAAAVGVALAWVHWLGLVAGGALVGLLSRSLARALLAGVGFGLLVSSLFVLSVGATGRLPEMTPAIYVTVAASFGLPLLGALARGVV